VPDSKIVSGTKKSCAMHNLPLETLDQAKCAVVSRCFRWMPDEIALLDPQGGYLRPEAAVMGYLKLAAADGAALHFGEKVTAIEPMTRRYDRFRYRTLHGQQGHRRDRLLDRRTGAGACAIMRCRSSRSSPGINPRDGFVTMPQRMPCSCATRVKTGPFFGFPAIGVDGVKVGRHAHFREPIDPNQPNPLVNDNGYGSARQFHQAPSAGRCRVRVRSTTCRYTMLPSEDFLLDLLPGDKRIVVAHRHAPAMVSSSPASSAKSWRIWRSTAARSCRSALFVCGNGSLYREPKSELRSRNDRFAALAAPWIWRD
jgi:sarcosine oxidase